MKRLERWLGALFAALLVGVAGAQAADTNVYGYLQFNIDRTYRNPDPDPSTGQISRDRPDPIVYNVLRMNVMIRSAWDEGYTTFVNLSGANASSQATPNEIVRNAWGEMPLPLSLGFLRVGKIYRPFSPYNERLDAVPTYLGIEAPELFDTDHLMMSRFVDVMVHNSFSLGRTYWSYAMTTGNPESRIGEEGTFPFGWDLKMELGHKFMLGHSGYLSGLMGPATKLGTTATGGIAPPEGGVAPWMTEDNYSAWGVYSEWDPGNWQLEVAAFGSHHNAHRNNKAVNNLLANAGLLPDQTARFGEVDASSKTITYNVNTTYIRVGYSFDTRIGEVVPYAFWDTYKNPEIVGSKAFGGDDEAGDFDGGSFTKATLGVAYRPNPNVAIKVDDSVHFFKLLGRKTDYHEYRIDVSYFFGS